MTYDLRFYRRGKTSLFSKAPAPLTAQELTAWARSQPHITIGEAGLVRAGRTFEALAPYLENLDHPAVEGLKVLRGGHDAEVGTLYDALTVDIPIGQFAMVKGNEALFDDTVE